MLLKVVLETRRTPNVCGVNYFNEPNEINVFDDNDLDAVL